MSTETNQLAMCEEDEPGLKRSADGAADSAQWKFLWLTRMQLGLLCLGAIIAGFKLESSAGKRGIEAAVLVTTVAALGVSVALKIGKFDDKWYRCRAAAETIKSEMWKLAMSPAADRPTREATYREALKRVTKPASIAKELAVYRQDGPDITDWMARTMALPLEKRAETYQKCRLESQRDWYFNRAAYNVRQEELWQWTVLALEFAAIGFGILRLMWPLTFSIGGVVGSTASALVAWTRTKRHSDLAVTYSLAAEDLRRIGSVPKSSMTEEELARLVDEVEKTISREHEVWVARRVPGEGTRG